MALKSFDHVNISFPRGRENEARDYYLGLLGMNEIPKPEPSANRGGAWFVAGNLSIHISPEDDFKPSKQAHMAIICDEYTALRAKLETNGYEIKDDDELEGVNRFFTFDIFGNRIELIDNDSPAYKNG